MRRASPNAMVRNEDEYRFPSGTKRDRKSERGAASHTGSSPFLRLELGQRKKFAIQTVF